MCKSDFWNKDSKCKTIQEELSIQLSAQDSLELTDDFQSINERIEHISKALKKYITWYRYTHTIEEYIDLKIDNIYTSKYGWCPLYSKKDLNLWPICEECWEEMSLEFQLFLREIPTLLCPENKDILQIYWCPHKCWEETISHEIRWLKESEITDPITEALWIPHKAQELKLENKKDYMSFTELWEPKDIWGNYDYELGIYDCDMETPKWKEEFRNEWQENYNQTCEKIGGYPAWIQNAWRCCENESLTCIAQIWLWEWYWTLLWCNECWTIHDEYQWT